MNRLRSLALVAGLLMGTRAAVADSPCVEDFDGNGVVDTGDIGLLLLDFGACPGCGADLDRDGEVSGSDLSLLLLSFGPCLGPSWATVLEWSPDPEVIYDANLRADITATHWPWRVRHNGSGIEMVLIPPGSYQRGCSPSQQWGCSVSGTEFPLHQVTLTRAFYLGRTEVTQAQWLSRMSSNPSFFSSSSSLVPASQVANRPVEMVSWNQVQSFCSVSGLRLPTEAEWEYAYRASTTTAFHGWAGNPSGTNDDDQVVNIAWILSNSGNQTRPVRGKAANGFGLYDMAGNVFEWCSDRFGIYLASDQTDPSGPSVGNNRVFRGGDWEIQTGFCRASYRDYFTPGSYTYYIGFRVAKAP